MTNTGGVSIKQKNYKLFRLIIIDEFKDAVSEQMNFKKVIG